MLIVHDKLFISFDAKYPVQLIQRCCTLRIYPGKDWRTSNQSLKSQI